jgi:hypothetical protein
MGLKGVDPREYLNDQEESSRLMLDGRQSTIWTAMPAIVQSVNLTAMTCVCQLAIQGRSEDQNGNIAYQNISVLQDVPIVFPAAGGFSITFPIEAGDEVLLVFAARCIDSWWQSGGYENLPLEQRMHDLSDAFAIPGPKSQPNVVGSISATDLQIRNNAGTVFVSIGASGKIGFQNATISLKTLLTNLNTDLSTFANSCSTASTVSQIATAAGILKTALTTIATEIGALLQ